MFLLEIESFTATIWLVVLIQILKREEYDGIDQSALECDKVFLN
jgi:hypothetical protein